MQIMRACVLTVFLGVSGMALNRGAQAQDSGPYKKTADAHRDIDSTLALAQVDHKLVLLEFGGNWCLDCHALHRLDADPAVAPYLEAHFHVVTIDVGDWDRNLDVNQEYGDPIDGGVPAVVVITAARQVVATTRNGALENARNASSAVILKYLKYWVAHTPAS